MSEKGKLNGYMGERMGKDKLVEMYVNGGQSEWMDG